MLDVKIFLLSIKQNYKIKVNFCQMRITVLTHDLKKQHIFFSPSSQIWEGKWKTEAEI